jgi:hypothetical protein
MERIVEVESVSFEEDNSRSKSYVLQIGMII